ncbi:MAG: type II toxin-antitoxin system prevent-host-death family antitoxin [Coriobacteriales bacterium]|jgi:prevent-host-death family protein|nr:type II toxin-antitoxin system prevent-host-death family antitoxin [Coriobacteriales bacterium]
MDALTVGEVKARFSEVLDTVRDGESVTVLYGRSKHPVAKIVPIVDKSGCRKVGVLEGKASFSTADNFKFSSVEEFLEESR